MGEGTALPDRRIQLINIKGFIGMKIPYSDHRGHNGGRRATSEATVCGRCVVRSGLFALSQSKSSKRFISDKGTIGTSPGRSLAGTA
jgi:hypothetical protein